MPSTWRRADVQRLPRRIQALIFDCDDTLVNASRAYAYGLLRAGLFDGPALSAAKQVVKRRLGAAHPASHQRLLYFKVLQEAGVLAGRLAPGPAALLALTRAYERAVVQHFAAQWRALRRGPWMQALAKQLPIAICTNETTRMQLQKWAVLDPAGRWCSAFVTSEEMGVEKPAAGMFEETAKRLGVAAHRCCMVGDSVRNDIVGAARLGMATVWTTEFLSPMAVASQRGRLPPRNGSAHSVVRRLSQLCFA